MPTFIADTLTAGGLSGSTEHRLDQSPDGTLWLLLVMGAAGKMFMSVDSGATWSYVATDVVLGTDANEAIYPSMFIDVDGFAHVTWASYVNTPQMLHYAYGKPLNGGGWVWTYTSFAAATGRLAARTDVVAFPESGVTQVFVAYSIHGVAGVAAPKVAKLHVSVFGVVTLDSATHGPPTTVDAGQYPSATIEFSHTGDGKTPMASPDVWLASSARTESRVVRGWRATYSGGVWTWGAATQMEATTYNIVNRLLQIMWTGATLVVTAVANNRLPRLWHWAGAAAVAHHNATAAPGAGNLTAGAWSMDPVTDDVYATYYDADDGDIMTTKYTFATNTWSAWSTPVVRAPSNVAQRLAMLRHPLYHAIPVVYGEELVAGTMKHYAHRLATLVRTPEAPILTFPADGAKLDLASGATFTWRHRPVGPGDVQQAWRLQRNTGMLGITYYWNQGALVWETSDFWNAGPAQEANFPGSAWDYGTNWQWGITTRSSAGVDSIPSDLQEVTSLEVPTVVVTAPAPVVYTDSTPTIAWSYTYAEAQKEYEVRVTLDDPDVDPDDPSPTVWTSGTVIDSSARAVAVNVPLIDETGYIAWVRARGADDSISPWASLPFHLSVDAPAGPTVSSEVIIEDELPTIYVTVTGTANSLDATQAQGTSGWAVRSLGKTLTVVAANVADGILAGFDMVKTGSAGTSDFISNEGSPPATDEGEPSNAGPLDFPVKAGLEYTFRGSVLSPQVARQATATIQWYADDDIAGSATAPDDSDTGASTLTSTVAYTTVYVTAVCPPGMTRARLVGSIANAATTDHHYWTKLDFHPGDATTFQPGGLSETMTLRVERSDDAGVTWETIATDVGTDYYQQAVVLDWSAPTATPLLYRAFMDLHVPSLTGGDQTVGSDPSDDEAQQVTVAEWIIRDADEGTGILATVVEHKRSDETPSEVHRPIGRGTPIVDLETISLAEGEFTIYVTPARYRKTLFLITRLQPIHMLSPQGWRYTVIFDKRDYETEIGKAETIKAHYVEVAPAKRVA